MDGIPFGKYKGTQINKLDKTYLLKLMGYIIPDKITLENRCTIPTEKPKWALSYESFYNKIKLYFDKCIRCDNKIHSELLCKKCYEKHKSEIIYRKNKKQNIDSFTDLTKYELFQNLTEIKNTDQEKLWQQSLPCFVCDTYKYSPIKLKNKNYNLCKFCHTNKIGEIKKIEIKKEYQESFSLEIYNKYKNELENKLQNIVIKNNTSREVTNIITKICKELAETHGFEVLLEKPHIDPIDKMANIFYDLELSNGTTKFIIEIDRTYNEKTIEKFRDSKYKKNLWIRWGIITKNDSNKNGIYDLLVLPLDCKGNIWNSQIKKKSILDYL